MTTTRTATVTTGTTTTTVSVLGFMDLEDGNVRIMAVSDGNVMNVRKGQTFEQTIPASDLGEPTP